MPIADLISSASANVVLERSPEATRLHEAIAGPEVSVSSAAPVPARDRGGLLRIDRDAVRRQAHLAGCCAPRTHPCPPEDIAAG